MRIAIFCNDFWPVIGGVPTATLGLGRALQARGHEVHVLTRNPGGCADHEDVDGLAVRRLDWNVRPRATFASRYWRARAAVGGALAGWGAEAVYAHFVSAHALYAAHAARGAHVPLLLSFRGNDAMRIAPRSVITRAIYRRLTRVAAANLFCSEWLRRETVRARWFQGRPETTGVLADAVEIARRTRPADLPGEPFALAAGRLVPKKGFDLLLEAWARASADVPLRLLIAGTGPEEPQLRALASRLSLGERVRFLGPVPHPQLLGILGHAALCVVPSREEPYGIIVVEAQALGTPVVATAVGNVPMLVEHRRTGYLAEPVPESLAARIVEAWNDSNLAGVATAARASPAANRGYDEMAAELERWIAQAITATSGNHRWT